MKTPTTKTELLERMAISHYDYIETLARIPQEQFDDVVLYGIWTIKDLIAHIGWWIESGAERVAAVRRDEPLEQFANYDPINEAILARFRHVPLASVQAMEARGWQAMEQQVQAASEEEMFETDRFATLQGRPLLNLVIEETYDHYDGHLADLKLGIHKINFA